MSENLDYVLGDLTAHEFGHILGLADEYSNARGCTNTADPVGTMGCWMRLPNGNLGIGPVQTRYFDDILSDLENIIGRPFDGGFAPLIPFINTGETFGTGESDVTSEQAPEPASLALLALGLAALRLTRPTGRSRLGV